MPLLQYSAGLVHSLDGLVFAPRRLLTQLPSSWGSTPEPLKFLQMATSVIFMTPRDAYGVRLCSAAAQGFGLDPVYEVKEPLPVRIDMPPSEAYEAMAQALAKHEADWNAHVELARPLQ